METNHGKPWTKEEDRTLIESRHLSDSHFSQTMLRSKAAIKYRRAHIAAKMFLQDPSTQLEEYVQLMSADSSIAATYLQAWQDRGIYPRATPQMWTEAQQNHTLMRAYQAEDVDEIIKPLPISEKRTSFSSAFHVIPQKEEGEFMSPQQKRVKPEQSEACQEWKMEILSVCQELKKLDGDIGRVFKQITTDPVHQTLVTTLIKYYPGFQAYAATVALESLRRS